MQLTNDYDIVIVGGGLSGLWTAFMLQEYTNYNIALFDKGTSFKVRLFNKSPEVLLSGIGGAGTLSGGKICGIPASRYIWEKTSYNIKQWNYFVDQLALPPISKESIINSKYGFFSSPKLSEIISKKNYPCFLLLEDEMHSFIACILNKLNPERITIYKKHALKNITKEGRLYKLVFSYNDCNSNIFKTRRVVIAIGRSGASSIEALLSPLKITSTPPVPDIGIRIQFPLTSSSEFQKVGQDIKLKMKLGDYTLRTFCTCSGGASIKMTIDGYDYYDGHFKKQKTQYTNIGLMSRNTSLKGLEISKLFCQALQISQSMSLEDFLLFQGILLQKKYHRLFNSTVESIAEFAKQLLRYGFIESHPKDIQVFLPSVDGYNPKIETSSSFETNCNGVFVIGDATGYSRGFLQSLWSAHCCANYITNQASVESDKVTVKRCAV